jgi:hypothetical protein
MNPAVLIALYRRAQWVGRKTRPPGFVTFSGDHPQYDRKPGEGFVTFSGDHPQYDRKPGEGFLTLSDHR